MYRLVSSSRESYAELWSSLLYKSVLYFSTIFVPSTNSRTKSSFCPSYRPGSWSLKSYQVLTPWRQFRNSAIQNLVRTALIDGHGAPEILIENSKTLSLESKTEKRHNNVIGMYIVKCFETDAEEQDYRTVIRLRSLHSTHKNLRVW